MPTPTGYDPGVPPRDKIEYSRHAESQMFARKITKDEVEAVITDADITTPGKKTPEKGQTKILRKTVEGRRLKVVITDSDPPKVITVAPIHD
jgi:hypothetical protein